MKQIITVIFALVAGFAASGSFGHHSVAAEYGGSSEPLHELKGTVTDVLWTSPHVKVTIEVAEGERAGEQWDILGHAPGLMARSYGILPDAVQVGSEVRALVWISKYGAPRSTPRAMSVDGGPLMSTLQSADTRDIRDGTLGEIVPAPALGKTEYNLN